MYWNVDILDAGHSFDVVIKMELKRYHVAFAIVVLSVIVFAAAVSYPQLTDKNASKPLNLSFPTGIPLGSGSVSAAQVGEQDFNTISVTGSGTASMQANEATVTLGVQTQAETAEEAISSNAELMTKIIDAVKALGLTDDDMKTVSYNVYPVYDTENYAEIVGYRVVNMIAVRITDMRLIGRVIDAAAENGANTIQGISFGLSDDNIAELKAEAYLAALSDAQEKAELIAEKLKLTITGVLYVSESYYQPYQPYADYRYAVAGKEAVSTPVIEGKLSVSVTVYIVYSFE